MLREIKKKGRRLGKEKRGLSEMVGYVLLIGIAISLSILVFTWMKLRIPKPTEYCPEDISLIIESYNCSEGNINLVLKNQGLFNIKGFFIRGSYSEGERPTKIMEYIEPDNPGEFILLGEDSDGAYNFPGNLEPGDKYGDDDNGWAKFEISEDELYSILIEPCIFDEEKNVKILCDNAIIIQDVDPDLCVRTGSD